MTLNMAAASVEGRATMPVLVARTCGERIAFALESVVEVLPAMATTALPSAPPVISGLINLRGTPLPVLDLATRLGGVPLGPDPEHHVVVCHVGDRRVGIWVEEVSDITTIDANGLVAVTDFAAARHVAGAAVLADGMLVVLDLRSFLDADEALMLDRAIVGALVEAAS